MPFWLISLFGNKLFRIAMAALAVVAMIGGGVWLVKHQIAKHDEAVVAAERQRVETETLKQGIADAEADREFADQTRKSQGADVVALEGRKQAQAGRIAAVGLTLKQTYAEADGEASEAILAAIAQIDVMQAERAAQ